MGSRGEGIAGLREKKQRTATRQGEQGGTKDEKRWKDSSQRMKTPGAKPIACISSKIRDDTPSLKGLCQTEWSYLGLGLGPSHHLKLPQDRTYSKDKSSFQGRQYLQDSGFRKSLGKFWKVSLNTVAR